MLGAMRIASLSPAATELLFALGLGEDVVAVTHACDFPLQAEELPQVTFALLPEGLEAGEHDAARLALRKEDSGAYGLDADRLWAVGPELIVTQDPAFAPAVSEHDLQALIGRMDPAPEVITLNSATLGEVLGDIRTIAGATDAKDAGVELVRGLADRIDRVRLAVRDARPVRVAALEWLEPVYPAGQWVPQMLEYAGGEAVLGFTGEESEPTDWEQLAAVQPEIVVVMPRGFDAERALEEAETFLDEIEATGARRVVAVDAAGLLSRPGPRLVEGLELLAHILHPTRVPDRPAGLLEVPL